MTPKQVPERTGRIMKLIGELDVAAWKWINASDEGPSAAFLKAKDDVYPKSQEEIGVWSELTSPDNNEALHQYVASFSGNLSEYARKLYDALVAESDRRTTGG